MVSAGKDGTVRIWSADGRRDARRCCTAIRARRWPRSSADDGPPGRQRRRPGRRAGLDVRGVRLAATRSCGWRGRAPGGELSAVERQRLLPQRRLSADSPAADAVRPVLRHQQPRGRRPARAVAAQRQLDRASAWFRDGSGHESLGLRRNSASSRSSTRSAAAAGGAIIGCAHGPASSYRYASALGQQAQQVGGDEAVLGNQERPRAHGGAAGGSRRAAPERVLVERPSRSSPRGST